MHLRPILSMSCGLLLLSCTPAVVKPTAQPGDGPQQVYVQAQEQLSGAGEWLPLEPEAVLHTGDRYKLAVQLSRPAYLYVGRSSSERPREQLLPRPGAPPMRSPAQQPITLPASDDGYTLDKQVGEESLLVVASDHALTPEALKGHFDSAQPAELGVTRTRPPILGDGNRGSSPPEYLAKTLAPGVMGLKFTFQHQQ